MNEIILKLLEFGATVVSTENALIVVDLSLEQTQHLFEYLKKNKAHAHVIFTGKDVFDVVIYKSKPEKVNIEEYKVLEEKK